MKISKLLMKNKEKIKNSYEKDGTVSVDKIRPVSDRFCVLLSDFSFLVEYISTSMKSINDKSEYLKDNNNRQLDIKRGVLKC